MAYVMNVMKKMGSGAFARTSAAVFGAFCATSAMVAFGCGGSDSGVRGSKLPDGVRSEVIEHEACDDTKNPAETVDTNNDGKPDIKRVMKGGREICRIADLDRDGKPDLFEYYDASGQIRRREADYDDNGVVNMIEYYEGGKLVRRETDTTNQGKLDTWDFFDPSTGKLVKRERDSLGSGRVDQWWTFDASGVTIARDRNGDGLPDPDATIVLDRTGAAVSSRGASSSSEDAGAATDASVPVEPQATVNTPGAEPSSPDLAAIRTPDAGAAVKSDTNKGKDAGAHP